MTRVKTGGEHSQCGVLQILWTESAAWSYADGGGREADLLLYEWERCRAAGGMTDSNV